jgi:hypothetical protein
MNLKVPNVKKVPRTISKIEIHHHCSLKYYQMNSQKDGVKKMKLDEKSVISVEPVGSTAKSSMEEPVIRLACDLVVTGISSKVVPMSEEVK